MKKGYARVSTVGQNVDRQERQLKEQGCEIIYIDKTSGRTTDRPELKRMLDELEAGDEILVTDLTRVSRSTRDLFKLVDIIRKKGATLKSIKDTWLNTSDENPYSDFLLTIMAAISELEVNLNKARQAEGIAIAKEKGKYRGSPRKIKPSKIDFAIDLYRKGDHTVKEIIDITGISRATFYRRLKEVE